ncbi:hypothetical protein EJ04DRAFT_518785 [Polyplosphaeria fusca]|uniref:MARVEL domain-containing protein n=1 Tax=Polyplosphaeria fusca TaxID=682080 RepID=A0A9P4RBZ3_9PLEO|nr:hypothetical protein EJ04DRAFT_518785 [Polyplosphaeria fusca]
MYMLKGGAVPIPRWILIFRFFQLLFAIVVLALTAYALSIGGGGPIQPPLITTIIIACLTILPILILTTPLHLVQRRVYDPRIALLLDGFAMLWWLGTMAALASYQRIFRRYGKDSVVVNEEFLGCRKCRRAWQSGTAATWFSAVEFFLFLFTTLAFIYYYHCHLAEIPAPGIGRRNTTKTSTAAGRGTSAGVGASAAETSTTPAHGNHQHEMSSIPHPTSGQVGYSGPNPPYPTDNETSSQPVRNHHQREQRQGEYGGYEPGSNEGYGATEQRPSVT